jgi:hypothetical protein
MRKDLLKKYSNFSGNTPKQDVIDLAERLNISWDYDPAFMYISQEITGKSLLDEMDDDDLKIMFDYISENPHPFTKATDIKRTSSEKRKTKPEFFRSNYDYDSKDKFEWGMFPNKEIVEGGKVSKIAKLHKVARSTVLNDISEIRTNFEDADFWVVREGSKDKVGSVMKEFAPQYIGIKITEEARDALDPRYVYYALMNIHNQGVWKELSYGSTNLVHIRIEDIKSIPIG